MKNDEKIIKDMYEQNKTPQYDIESAVMNKLNSRKHTPKGNRKMLIAAVMIFVFLLAGTAAAAGIISGGQVFMFPGESQNPGVLQPQITPTATPMPDLNSINIISHPEEDAIMMAFLDQIQSGEYRCAFYIPDDGCTTGSSVAPKMECSSYTELISSLENSNTYFPVPEYIPGGYEMKECTIYYYTDSTVADIEPEITYKDNFMLLLYRLDDNCMNNVLSYTLWYENDKGERIKIRANLDYAQDGGYGASDTATAESVNIKGYGTSLLIHDTQNEFGYSYNLILKKDIETVESATLFVNLIDDINAYKFEVDLVDHIYEKLSFNIRADSLSKREIIKIAENLK